MTRLDGNCMTMDCTARRCSAGRSLSGPTRNQDVTRAKAFRSMLAGLLMQGDLRLQSDLPWRRNLPMQGNLPMQDGLVRNRPNVLARWGTVLLAICVSLLGTLLADAQQPPTIGYIYPPGGRAGTTVEVQLGGYDFTPDTQFFVLDSRAKLEVTGPPGALLYPGAPHWFGPKAINANKPYGIPREVPARLTLPAELPPGIIRWQAANANGVSAIGLFYVSHDDLEIKEEDCPTARFVTAEPSSTSDRSHRQISSLPVTISGRLHKKEEVDRYLLVAPRDGLISVDLHGPALGLSLNAILEIRDSDGRMLANAGDSAGRGLGVSFVGQAGKTYELTLYDLDYRGNRGVVYRLSLYEAPRIVATLPMRAQRGSTREVEFVGYGLATGQPYLETVKRTVTFPSDTKQEQFLYRLETPFGNPPAVSFSLTDLPEQLEAQLPIVPAVAVAAAGDDTRGGDASGGDKVSGGSVTSGEGTGVAATASSTSAQTAVGADSAEGANNSQEVVAATHEAVSAERQLTIPAAVTGRYDDPLRDETYWIEAKKDEVWWIEVEAAAKAAPLDLALNLFQADGKPLVTNDDLPGTTNAGLLFQVPADGRYRVVVSDLATALLGGSSASDSTSASSSGEATVSSGKTESSSTALDGERIYRLAISRQAAGFQLKVATQATVTVGDPPVEIPANGRAPNAKSGVLTFEITRAPGFVDPVVIKLDSLPSGVQAPAEVTIDAKANSVSIPLVCPADAATWASLVQVHARSVPNALAENQTGKDATAQADSTGKTSAEKPQGDAVPSPSETASKSASAAETPPGVPVYERTAQVLIAPVMKPRAVIQPFYPDAARTVSRGATYPAPVVIERLEGYEGEVELQMAGMPDRVRQGILGGTLTVPPGVAQIDYPLYLPEFVQTDRTSRIFLNAIVRLADGQGNVRHLVNRMVKRITMNVEGAVLKVSTATDEFLWKGDELAIPVEILRTPKLSGPVWVSLAVDDYSQGPPVVEPNGPSDEQLVPPGFRATAIRLEPDQQAGTLLVRTAGEALPVGEHRLVIEARGIRENLPVVSQTEVFITVAQPVQVSELHTQIDQLLTQAPDSALPVATRADDAEFIRRVYLDLAGRIPTLPEMTAFLNEPAETKRVQLIDRLLVSPDYARRMQEVFNSILIERRGDDPEWQAFLRHAFEQNLPWDVIAQAIARPPVEDEKLRGAAFFMTSRLISEGAMAPVDVPGLTRDFGRLLVGVDLQCAQCHDHLTIDDYSQRDFQSLHMIFENLEKRSDVKFPAVNEKVMTQPKTFMSVFTQQPMETMPAVPGGKEIPIVKFAAGEEFLVAPDRKARTPGVPKFSPLAKLSEELTSKQNDFFSRNIANRLWHLMFGRGLVEPLDLHHSGNPPSHPELLDLLAKELADHQFNLRWLIRELALTEAYQRSSVVAGQHSVPIAANAPVNYQVGREKRILAETLFWSVVVATGPLPEINAGSNSTGPATDSAHPATPANDAVANEPEAKAADDSAAKKDQAKPADSVRAWLEQQLAQSKDLQTLQELFVKTFANPAREPEYEFEPTVKGALFLMHDQRMLKLLSPQPGNLVDRLSRIDDPDSLAEQLFLSVLNRRPTAEDRQDVADYLAQHADQRVAAITDLAWALLSSTEFCLNH